MKKAHLPILILLALLGLGSIRLMSPAGIGVSPDSVDYLSLARSLTAGDGYQVSYRQADGPNASAAHFPPLFPGLVAGVSKVSGLDAWPAAGWLNSLLFGLSVFLVGFLAGRAGGHVCVGWIAAFLVLTSTDMLMVHAMAWSEAVFVPLMLLGFYLLARHLEQPKTWLLVAAALTCGLALLARYAAVTLLMTGVFVLFFQARPILQRLYQAILFGIVGSSPLLALLIKNASDSGSATNRSFVFHPVSLAALEEGVSTFSKWLIPDFLDTRIRIALFVVMLAVLAAGIWKCRLHQAVRSRIAEQPFLRVLFHFVWIYPAFLIVYISFFSVGTFFNYRMMLPVLLCLLIWMPSLYPNVRLQRWFRIFLLGLFITYPLRAGVKIAETRQAGGRGYASRAWQEGATLGWVRDYDGSKPIRSNGREPIYLLTEKITGTLPRKIIYAHGTPNPAYEEEWQAMENELKASGGFFVFFDDLRWRKFTPDDAELTQRLTLREHAVFDDGIVYEYQPSADPGGERPE